MKTRITHLLKLTFLMLASISIFCCSKNDDNNQDAINNNNNNYNYQQVQTNIVNAEYFSQGQAPNNVISVSFLGEAGSSKWVQIFFFNVTTIPIGSFVYKSNTATGYLPNKHFSGGSVNLGIAMADEINGGTVTVSKTDDIYTVTAKANTAKGPITVNYIGKIIQK